MRKTAFSAIIIMTVLMAVFMQVDWNVHKFADTLQINPENITELELSMPNDSTYRTTTDHTKIQELLHYLNTKDY